MCTEPFHRQMFPVTGNGLTVYHCVIMNNMPNFDCSCKPVRLNLRSLTYACLPLNVLPCYSNFFHMLFVTYLIISNLPFFVWNTSLILYRAVRSPQGVSSYDKSIFVMNFQCLTSLRTLPTQYALMSWLLFSVCSLFRRLLPLRDSIW